MLTSEIPFVGEDRTLPDSTDFQSDLDMGSTSDQSGASWPIMDMGLVLDYCRNVKPFPVESLQNNGVSEDGVGFVKSLMVANPLGRVSAAEALKSVWLSEMGPQGRELSDSGSRSAVLPPRAPIRLVILISIKIQSLLTHTINYFSIYPTPIARC